MICPMYISKVAMVDSECISVYFYGFIKSKFCQVSGNLSQIVRNTKSVAKSLQNFTLSMPHHAYIRDHQTKRGLPPISRLCPLNNLKIISTLVTSTDTVVICRPRNNF
jgi:hypothetical protein